MDLVFRRAQADGAVVVALLGRARRHLCGRASTLFWGALCLRLWDPLCRPDFAGVDACSGFYDRCDYCLTRIAVTALLSARKTRHWCLLVSYRPLAAPAARQLPQASLRLLLLGA